MTDSQFDCILRIIVDTISPDESVSESELRNQVENICNLASFFLRDSSIENISEEIKDELFLKASEKKVYIDWEPMIGIFFDKRTKLTPWFESSISKPKRYYWNRYKEFLLKKESLDTKTG